MLPRHNANPQKISKSISCINYLRQNLHAKNLQSKSGLLQTKVYGSYVSFQVFLEKVGLNYSKLAFPVITSLFLRIEMHQ